MRQDGGDHGVGADPRLVQLAQCPHPFVDGGRIGLEQLAHAIIGGGDAQPDLEIFPRFQHVQVAQHHRRAGLDGDRPVMFSQDLQALAGELIFPFQRLVRVAHPADPHPVQVFCG